MLIIHWLNLLIVILGSQGHIKAQIKENRNNEVQVDLCNSCKKTFVKLSDWDYSLVEC